MHSAVNSSSNFQRKLNKLVFYARRSGYTSPLVCSTHKCTHTHTHTNADSIPYLVEMLCSRQKHEHSHTNAFVLYCDSYRQMAILSMSATTTEQTVNGTNTQTHSHDVTPSFSVSIRIMNTYLFHLENSLHFYRIYCKIGDSEHRTHSGDKFHQRNCYSISIALQADYLYVQLCVCLGLLSIIIIIRSFPCCACAATNVGEWHEMQFLSVGCASRLHIAHDTVSFMQSNIFVCGFSFTWRPKTLMAEQRNRSKMEICTEKK